MSKEQPAKCAYGECTENAAPGNTYCGSHNVYRPGPRQARLVVSHDADLVHQPPHYTAGEVEVIDFIEQCANTWPREVIGHLFNVIKYTARCGLKGEAVEDLRKARQYLNRAINLLEGRKSWEPEG